MALVMPAAGLPHGRRARRLLRDRLVVAARLQTGKEPAVPLPHRPVVSPGLLVESRSERNFAVFAAFALTNADDHALLIESSGQRWHNWERPIPVE